MHELSIVQSLIATITARTGDARVTRVRLEIGELSGVMVPSIRFCFEVVAAGTGVDGADLEISEPHGRARCRTCATEFETDDPIVLCPACSGARVDILAGRELRLISVDILEGDPPCAPPAAAPTRTP